MEPSQQRKVVLLAALLLTSLPLTADLTGLGVSPGIGPLQAIGTIATAVAAFLYHRRLLRLEREDEHYRPGSPLRRSLVMNPVALRNVLLLAGGVILATSLVADDIGLGPTPGLGYAQQVGIVTGAALFGSGLFLFRLMWQKAKALRWLYSLGLVLLACVVGYSALQRGDVFPMSEMVSLLLAMGVSAWLLLFSRHASAFFRAERREELAEPEEGTEPEEEEFRVPPAPAPASARRCPDCESSVPPPLRWCPQCGRYCG